MTSQQQALNYPDSHISCSLHIDFHRVLTCSASSSSASHLFCIFLMHFSPVLPRSYPFLTCSASSSSVSHLSCLVLIHFSPVLSRPQPFLTCFASSPSPLHIFPRRSPISYLFCLFLIQFLTCSASSASTFHHSTSTSFAFSPVLPLPSPLSHLLCLFLLRFLRLTLLAAHGLGRSWWFLFRYVFFHRWSVTQQ